MIIDFHTHVFPERIAARAMARLSDTANGLPYQYDGTVAGLLRRMDESHVDRAVILPIATNAHQQRSVNDFAAAAASERILAFGSVFPCAPDALDELRRVKALGLRGIKLHPDYAGCFIDEEAMLSVLTEAEALGLPVVLHMGVDPVSPALVHCGADRVAALLPKFPRLTVIGAHMGGLDDWDRAERYLVGTRVYLDTSMAAGRCAASQFARMVRAHGVDRVLFATDGPWSRAEDALAFLDEAGLTRDEKEAIIHGSAEALLNL